MLTVFNCNTITKNTKDKKNKALQYILIDNTW